MGMVAEEALQAGPNPGFCYIKDTFTAIQEGKPSKTVETIFFLTVVPIEQHNSDLLVQQSPKANQDHYYRAPSKDEFKRQLSTSGSAGWSFIDLLSDFHLLLYLSQFLDMESDMPKICESIINQDIPLNASMAGMDGSY
jgi:nuclear protein localization family protein 4